MTDILKAAASSLPDFDRLGIYASLAGHFNLTPHAVHKWRENGVLSRYIQPLADLSGYPLETVVMTSYRTKEQSRNGNGKAD